MVAELAIEGLITSAISATSKPLVATKSFPAKSLNAPSLMSSKIGLPSPTLWLEKYSISTRDFSGSFSSKKSNSAAKISLPPKLTEFVSLTARLMFLRNAKSKL